MLYYLLKNLSNFVFCEFDSRLQRAGILGSQRNLRLFFVCSPSLTQYKDLKNKAALQKILLATEKGTKLSPHGKGIEGMHMDNRMPVVDEALSQMTKDVVYIR